LLKYSFFFGYSIAIGREGGVGPLLALARSEIEVGAFVNFFLRLRSYFQILLYTFIYFTEVLSSSFLFFLKDVHETAAGALWNLAFYSGNALHIVEEGGVPILVNLCSSSGSKMARFMSALALAYMFDGRYT
jgi:Armadillo/beta-catenin-like repeat